MMGKTNVNPEQEAFASERGTTARRARTNGGGTKRRDLGWYFTLKMLAIIQALGELSKSEMTQFSKSHRSRQSAENAYTLIELLAVIFIMALAIAAYEAVRTRHGTGLAAVAGALAVLVGVLLV